MPDAFRYDVALSFAGEDRAFVARVTELLNAAQVRVFYDEYEKVTLWGKDLYTHLRDVYQTQARYTVLFASEHYAKKVWTNHERESAQARAIGERTEYVLPVRFDDSVIPGLLATTGYIDLRSTSPEELAALVLAKLGRQSPSWETAPRPTLPGESAEHGESLRDMAARLAAASSSHARRERLLASEAGVQAAKKEAEALTTVLESDVAFLKGTDSSLEIGCGVTPQRVIFVSTHRASFTMYLQLQYSNTLKGAGLYVQEFDSYYRPGGRRKEASRTADWDFEFDEADAPRWRPAEGNGVPLSTKQLAERYLSWVLKQAYATSPRERAR